MKMERIGDWDTVTLGENSPLTWKWELPITDKRDSPNRILSEIISMLMSIDYQIAFHMTINFPTKTIAK
jgi:hypothetical protein